MAYCKHCKKEVKTAIKFDRLGMAYLECKDCETELTEKYSDSVDDDSDWYEAGFMNDFGDSN